MKFGQGTASVPKGGQVYYVIFSRVCTTIRIPYFGLSVIKGSGSTG